MSSVNKVILLGNVGKAPEIRTFQNGNRVCSFALATSEKWKDKNSGQQKENTEWHNVVVLNEPLIKLCEQYISKGSKLFVEGQLVTRKWQDKVGNDRFSTEVQLKPFNGSIVLLGGKTEADPAVYDQSPPAPDMDDEIPF